MLGLYAVCTCLTQDLSVTIQVDRNDDGEEETKKEYILYILDSF